MIINYYLPFPDACKRQIEFTQQLNEFACKAMVPLLNTASNEKL